MTSKTTNKFSTEVHARAVRMVLDHKAEHPSRLQAILSIVGKIVSVAPSPYELPVDGAGSVSARHQGMSSPMRLLGHPLIRRVSRSMKYRWGSTPFILQVSTSEAMAAQRAPPSSPLANSAFLRLRCPPSSPLRQFGAVEQRRISGSS